MLCFQFWEENMAFWKINCMENDYPGMWQRWFLHQCVGVGWYSGWGFHLTGNTKGGRGWKVARNALQKIEVGDHVVVALSNHRVGRIGEVTGKAVEDSDWVPLVPPSSSLPDGEMGRRIFVRWDMMVGPESREMVVGLPTETQFTTGELRPTLSQIRSVSPAALRRAMNDPVNWVALWAHFDYERALSGYIAAYPHRLEDGLLQHPNEKVRERVFGDQSRSDVILIDRKGIPVVVECKQGQPSIADIKQLRHYLRALQKETGSKARGLLVHGGARKILPEVSAAARSKPSVELVQYRLDVEFTPCG
jgi:hypothetical protein